MAPPARICIVSEIYHPEDPGGQGRQAHDLSTALRAAGCEVRALTRRHFAASRKREMLGMVMVRRLPPLGMTKGDGWRALAPTLVFLISLTWMLLRDARHYDSILVHGVKLILVPPLLVGMLFGKRVFAKVDATAEIEHAITAESLQRMKMRQSSRLIRAWTATRRRLLRTADAIIAISGEVKEALLRNGARSEQVFDIPNGLDLQRWQLAAPAEKQALRRDLELPARPLVICVGRLSRAKGVHTVLQAWFALCDERLDAHLLLVGSGVGSYDDCERELRALCAASPHRDRVIFTGQVDNVHDYLRAADVFVQCSEHEGFGLALVEAMACGLPCVTTPVGAARDVVEAGVNGVLVPVGDAVALAGELRALLERGDRREAMGAAARRAVISRYDLQQVAQRYLQLLQVPR